MASTHDTIQTEEEKGTRSPPPLGESTGWRDEAAAVISDVKRCVEKIQIAEKIEVIEWFYKHTNRKRD